MATLTIAIRADAMDAWTELQRALTDAGPVPCLADPAAWTSDAAEVRAYAARACRRCPVLAECATFAEANREPFGVWAGLDRANGINERRKTA
ncbi:MAG: hypothetical protein BGO26_16680 [Actinobacteria bacterium 69-20]|nr:WhiB family transcriptional regulator [Actinomycetota bacterium]OJV27108.1 MAG: hypothetical protein BGO26_16680 [Actinobacteria bacterium 69-20]